ncbi:MAG: cupredoxin domain-containing protein [Opitutaceae bacterium]
MPNTSNPASTRESGKAGPITAVGFAVLLAATALAALIGRADPVAGPRVHVVVIENMRYSPSILDVPLGDRVVFKNHDLVPHTATSKGAEPFDSGPLLSGQEWGFTPARPGTLRYNCSFHPTMEGSLVVGEPHKLAAP